MQKDNTVKKIAEYKDKSLLIVDDDNPFRDRLSRAMEKKGFIVTQAESVKKGIESVALIKPAFEKNGTITAANASKLNDGAAALLLASEQKVKK